MPRWLRVVRAVVGTGLTFALGVGVVAGAIGAVIWITGGAVMLDVMRLVGRLTVVAFLLGVGFSGVLALTARRRTLQQLSLGFGGMIGGAAGLLYFLFLALNGGRTWSLPVAAVNFALLLVMGTASGAGTLLVARRAGAALSSGNEPERLESGDRDA